MIESRSADDGGEILIGVIEVDIYRDSRNAAGPAILPDPYIAGVGWRRCADMRDPDRVARNTRGRVAVETCQSGGRHIDCRKVTDLFDALQKRVNNRQLLRRFHARIADAAA